MKFLLAESLAQRRADKLDGLRGFIADAEFARLRLGTGSFGSGEPGGEVAVQVVQGGNFGLRVLNRDTRLLEFLFQTRDQLLKILLVVVWLRHKDCSRGGKVA